MNLRAVLQADSKVHVTAGAFLPDVPGFFVMALRLGFLSPPRSALFLTSLLVVGADVRRVLVTIVIIVSPRSRVRTPGCLGHQNSVGFVPFLLLDCYRILVPFDK